MQEIIQYIREDRIPVGVMVAVKIGNSVTIGWSKCNKRDVFNRELGLTVARIRAVKGTKVQIPRANREDLEYFKNRAERYFKTKIN